MSNKDTTKIKLYGIETCHKTQYYKGLLDKTELTYQFLDVAQNASHAEELRGLYEDNNLNFPTITIGRKKLRNPQKPELELWLDKLIPNRL
jgi:arsenate reductase-like glutaredoxin family protein